MDEALFRDTVDIFIRRSPEQIGVVPNFVFATSDDARFLEETKLGNAVPVFTLDDVSLPKGMSGRDGGSGSSLGTSASAAGRSITAEEVRAALPAMDVAVCSKAALLVLNYFSTYSALIKAKARAQPNFVSGRYWKNPPALSDWWAEFFAWLHRLFGRS